MPTLSAGAISNRAARRSTRGVTLLELLFVVAIMALMAGLTYPSAAAGIDSLRLRSASDRIVSFLNTSLARAERRQQVVEIRISPAENSFSARSADLSFQSSFTLPTAVRIASITPALAAAVPADEPRRFLVYPGGTAPGITIELITNDGRKRQVSVDPITGMPHSEVVP